MVLGQTHSTSVGWRYVCQFLALWPRGVLNWGFIPDNFVFGDSTVHGDRDILESFFWLNCRWCQVGAPRNSESPLYLNVLYTVRITIESCWTRAGVSIVFVRRHWRAARASNDALGKVGKFAQLKWDDKIRREYMAESNETEQALRLLSRLGYHGELVIRTKARWV